MAYSAMTVAKYFLSLQDEDSGDLVSNLKLQKLLYYAQGLYVALHGDDSPLFNDKIYAWKHGPVVQGVYRHYAPGSSALPIELRPKAITDDVAAYLDEVYRVFGKFSAWKLREMTHREAPWLDHYVPDVLDIEIPREALHGYFSRYVETEAEPQAN